MGFADKRASSSFRLSRLKVHDEHISQGDVGGGGQRHLEVAVDCAAFTAVNAGRYGVAVYRGSELAEILEEEAAACGIAPYAAMLPGNVR